MTGRHKILVEQNADVPMRDGAILRANVYRPNAGGRFPVLMTFGPYGKDVPLREFMQEAWDRLNRTYPEILAASSCKHLVFERPDPEMWVPDGYNTRRAALLLSLISRLLPLDGSGRASHSEQFKSTQGPAVRWVVS